MGSSALLTVVLAGVLLRISTIHAGEFMATLRCLLLVVVQFENSFDTNRCNANCLLALLNQPNITDTCLVSPNCT